MLLVSLRDGGTWPAGSWRRKENCVFLWFCQRLRHGRKGDSSPSQLGFKTRNQAIHWSSDKCEPVCKTSFFRQMKKFVLELCVSNLEKFSDNSMVCLQGKDTIYGFPPSNKRNHSWLTTSKDWQQDVKSYLDFDAAMSRLSLQLNSAITYNLYYGHHMYFSVCSNHQRVSWSELWRCRILERGGGRELRCKTSSFVPWIRNHLILFQVNCCYDEGSKMLVYFGGTMGAFIWKCSMWKSKSRILSVNNFIQTVKNNWVTSVCANIPT